MPFAAKPSRDLHKIMSCNLKNARNGESISKTPKWRSLKPLALKKWDEILWRFSVEKATGEQGEQQLYTWFQTGRHFSFLLFICKLALVASFLNWKFKEYVPLRLKLLKLFYYQTFLETWRTEHSWYEHYKNAIKIWGHRACLRVSRLLKWGILLVAR